MLQRRVICPDKKMLRVMTAARELFVHHGFHNVSLPQIVESSGVSTGAIYHHFQNKEGIARFVHDMTLHEIQETLTRRLKETDTIRERLEAFTAVIFDITESAPEMMSYMLFMEHDHFLPGTLPICATESFCLVQDIIHEGMKTGDLKVTDVMIAATSFTGVLLRAVELRLRGVISMPLSEHRSELFENAWKTISC